MVTDVTNDDRCLNCHCINLKEGDARRGEKFVISDGVNCEGCHGPAGDWFFAHTESKKWRYSKPDIKASYGMWDIRNAVKRAEVCSSCHIGNHEQGKWVTHEMYAAGHPPLPGIELATFSHDLPNHWYLPKEKSKKVQEELKSQLEVDSSEAVHTKYAVIGGAVAFRESMKLLAAEAENCLKSPAESTRDYAQFDCAACHHDLKRASWRQRRNSTGNPGRPTMRSWPMALIGPIMRFADVNAAEYQANVAELARAFDARPFGDPGAIACAARKHATWADKLISNLIKRRYDPNETYSLLQQLCSVPKTDHLDYDSARQVAWAISIIYNKDVIPKPPNHEQIVPVIGRMTKGLKLALPSGRQRSIEGELPAALEAAAEYEPSRFKEDTEELSRLLPLK